MSNRIRKSYPFVLLLMMVLSFGYAVNLGQLEPAEFTFNNGAEIKTVDPALATGAPEGRIINGLFEGLLRNLPSTDQADANGTVPMLPVTKGMAESYSVSEDGTVYTFRIRQNVLWSNGDPFTAHDMEWSWMRMLHPETASEYVYQLYYIKGADRYNKGELDSGDRVEIELADRANAQQLFPRGTIRRGVFSKIGYWNFDTEILTDTTPQRGTSWTKVFFVEVFPEKNGQVRWDATPQATVYGMHNASNGKLPEMIAGRPVETCHHVLIDFKSSVGILAIDDQTFRVQLKSRTTYFPDLVAFYPLYPVHRPTIEKYGSPDWTKPGNIVCNGPFVLQFRRIRDRLRMIKNPHYWNVKHVELNTIDALSVQSETTSLNMYVNGQIDWSTTVPNMVIPDLRKRDDFKSAPMLTTYFYRFNVYRKPLDQVRVRRALNMAIDKKKIVEQVTKAGNVAARSFVPPGIDNYTSAMGDMFDVSKARRLLAEAGFPGGRNFPAIRILFNTSDMHKDIAQVIQQDWKEHLGVNVQLENYEWRTFLATLSQKDYEVARSGWIGDYPDPNTFLDMFVTDGANNQTNWSNARYDELIEQAKFEPDYQIRLGLLTEAEQILMDEQPIIPIYFYVSKNLVQPHVLGFSNNVQDVHPLHILKLDNQ